MIQFLIRILVILVVTKTISLLVLSFLPNDGIELESKNNHNPKYQRVDFKNMLGISQSKVKQTKVKSSNATTITNMILKGLFGTKTNGYAIVALKAKPKESTFLSVGESFKGYKLINILKDRVIFTRDYKEYILKIKSSKIIDANISYITEPKYNENVKIVPKTNISYYISNPKKVWNDIAIAPINNPKGYKVTRIKKNSKMDRLGLKKGDIIIKANNIELKSLKSVMQIYNNIKDITAMEIVVIRNNKEVELMYEID